MSIGLEGCGIVLKELREECEKTTADFAASLGMPLTRLWALENNDQAVTLHVIKQFAQAGKVEEIVLILQCLQCAYPELQEDNTRVLFEELLEAIEPLKVIA